MVNESVLIDLLGSIADCARTPDGTLDRLALKTSPAAKRHRRWLPIAATVAAITAIVVGSVMVRGDDSHRGDPVAIRPPVPLLGGAYYARPLNPYYATDAQHRTLQRAQFVLAQRCAQARGVTVLMADIPASDPRPQFLALIANDVRPLTLQQARTIGYDLYPSPHSAYAAAEAALTPQQLAILQGWRSDSTLAKPKDPFLLHGGCLGQATQTLLTNATPARTPGVTNIDGQPGLYDDDATVLNTYVNRARSGEDSPTVRRAQQQWSTCTSAHGYPGLRMTTESIQSNGSNLQSFGARRKAVQDVECKQMTGFLAVFIASVTKAQNAVIAADPSRLAGFRKRLETRMANAATAPSVLLEALRRISQAAPGAAGSNAD